jgi:5'-methylthioadenosine phosphorylase
VASNGALGIIAGTGFYRIDALGGAETTIVHTDFGDARVVAGDWHGRRTVFCTRHGVDHSVPPHQVNYRANVKALDDLGVSEILAVNVVGGIGLDAGQLVVVDDFVDWTKGRASTFFDGSTSEGVVHVDMGEPYDARLRAVWIEAAAEQAVPVVPHGVYGCFEGPRFETKAEIRMAAAAGVTVVGMTGVPEVVLANELDIPYAALCIVANPAAGLGEIPITVEDVQRVVADGATSVAGILDCAARRLASA